jgi:uncharacterized protein
LTELAPHTVVLLRWPADKPDFSDEELERLQDQHLAFLASLRDRGILLASGPLADQEDESWRGICFYSVPPEEARRLAAEDPSVQAARLEPVVFTWLTAPGSVAFGT